MIVGYGNIGFSISAMLKKSLKANVIGISE